MQYVILFSFFLYDKEMVDLLRPGDKYQRVILSHGYWHCFWHFLLPWQVVITASLTYCFGLNPCTKFHEFEILRTIHVKDSAFPVNWALLLKVHLSTSLSLWEYPSYVICVWVCKCLQGLQCESKSILKKTCDTHFHSSFVV